MVDVVVRRVGHVVGDTTVYRVGRGRAVAVRITVRQRRLGVGREVELVIVLEQEGLLDPDDLRVVAGLDSNKAVVCSHIGLGDPESQHTRFTHCQCLVFVVAQYHSLGDVFEYGVVAVDCARLSTNAWFLPATKTISKPRS